MPIKTITKSDTVNEFYNWLTDHPEITEINGYQLDRTDLGKVSRFCFGSLYHTFDADYIWAERKALNDWIRAYNARESKAAGWARQASAAVLYRVEIHDGCGLNSYTVTHMDEIELCQAHPAVASLVLGCQLGDHFFLKLEADATEIRITKI